MKNTAKVDRVQAIREQLICSIFLFFRNESLISSHTLAAAAHQLLHDLYERETSPYCLNITPESYRSALIKLIRKPQNFFKHGGPSMENSIEFNEGP